MSVDKDTVRRVARLARIAVSDDEIAALQADLNGILGFVEQLGAVNVDGVEPMTTAVAMAMKMRDDVVTEGDAADQVVANAPATADHFFQVPKVVE
jgi:aspartyl-tRNA(Asn)/glutamyl-tRNA(Gln) amidotransferase subunit C